MPTDPKITRAQRQMLKSVDRLKLEDVLHADRVRRRSNIMAVGLFGLVVGIYVYTIRKMGQESFLDDDEPMIEQKR